jgi:hypothetical protein
MRGLLAPSVRLVPAGQLGQYISVQRDLEHSGNEPKRADENNVMSMASAAVQ